MRIRPWNHVGGPLALAIVVLTGGDWTKAQDPQSPQEQKARIDVEAPGDDAVPARANFYRKVLALKEADETETSKASDSYWIGVQLKTLDEFALAHLNLKQAVAAESVFDDSPAAKAGVQKHDVLLKFGDTPIAAPQDLVEAVGKHQDKEVELHVLRGGKEATLKVTAIKRPTSAKVLSVELAKDSDELRRVEAWVERLRKPAAGEDPKAIFFMRPGVMVADRLALIQYPKDLSITIEKQGNEPIKIRAKKGDKSWETTSDKLGELPADVQPFVQHLLSGAAGPIAQSMQMPLMQMQMNPTATPKYTARTAPVPVPPTPALPKMTVRSYQQMARPKEPQTIEDVQRELQQLLKKVEELKTPPKAETPLEQMRREVDQLRKELDALRKASGK